MWLNYTNTFALIFTVHCTSSCYSLFLISFMSYKVFNQVFNGQHLWLTQRVLVGKCCASAIKAC